MNKELRSIFMRAAENAHPIFVQNAWTYGEEPVSIDDLFEVIVHLYKAAKKHERGGAVSSGRFCVHVNKEGTWQEVIVSLELGVGVRRG